MNNRIVHTQTIQVRLGETPKPLFYVPLRQDVVIEPDLNIRTVAISLWDKKEDAEAYQRGSYTEVLKALAKVVDGTPEVRNFELANSTLEKPAVRVAA